LAFIVFGSAVFSVLASIDEATGAGHLDAAYGATMPAAWVPAPQDQGYMLRRQWLASSVAAASIACVHTPDEAAALGVKDKFDGSFQDPALEAKCPEGCERTINAEGGFALIRGRDRPDGKLWNVFATYDGKQMVADMTSRGGPKKLTGKWVGKEKTIEWEDGSVWEKMMFKIIPAPFEIENLNGGMRQDMLNSGEISKRR